MEKTMRKSRFFFRFILQSHIVRTGLHCRTRKEFHETTIEETRQHGYTVPQLQ